MPRGLSRRGPPRPRPRRPAQRLRPGPQPHSGWISDGRRPPWPWDSCFLKLRWFPFWSWPPLCALRGQAGRRQGVGGEEVGAGRGPRGSPPRPRPGWPPAPCGLSSGSAPRSREHSLETWGAVTQAEGGRRTTPCSPWLGPWEKRCVPPGVGPHPCVWRVGD